MNGTGVKGGAFGFRVSSINKVGCVVYRLWNIALTHIMCDQLVDTKSVHNTTLLHFLERTVAKHFPDMETFLDELAAPAEAYRGAIVEHIIVHGLMLSPSEPAGSQERARRAA